MAVRWFTSSSSLSVQRLRWGGNRGSTLRSVGEAGKFLESGLDGTPGAFAATDDEDGVVPRDGADDLLPARPVDRKTQRLRAASRRLDDEQGPHAVHGDEHRGEELLQAGTDAGALEGRRVMRASVGGGDLGEAEITDIPGQRRLGDGEAFRFERSEERRVGKECRSRWSPYRY